MTAKQFLKSNAFRCILVLTIIALIAGGLLAILSDALYVSDEERTARIIKKIYDKDVTYQTCSVDPSDPDGATLDNPYGTINAVYFLPDEEAYLIQSTGNDGYKGGTVTSWVVADFKEGAYRGLGKVAVESNTKQTLMSAFHNDYFTFYTTLNDKIEAGGWYGVAETDNTVKHLQSGASYSSKAINNSVNGALWYIRNYLTVKGGGQA